MCVIFFNNISQCYLNLKKFGEARNYAYFVINLDPENIKGMFRLCKAY